MARVSLARPAEDRISAHYDAYADAPAFAMPARRWFATNCARPG